MEFMNVALMLAGGIGTRMGTNTSQEQHDVGVKRPKVIRIALNIAVHESCDPRHTDQERLKRGLCPHII